MMIYEWIADNFIEIFGAVSGVLYVFLEIRQTIWLWPVGIVTSAVYIWVFFTGKLYADMSLQVYYLIISILGWYWWVKGSGHWAQGSELRAQGEEKLAQGSGLRTQGEEKLAEGSGFRAQGRRESDRSGENGGRGDKKQELQVTRLKLRTGFILSVIFVMLFVVMWFVLSRMTDSPVPGRDAFVTSLSIVATWMLARKIYEHWYLWIVVNAVATLLFLSRGLYPTVILYIVYGVMSFAGLKAWGKTIRVEMPHPPTPSPGGEGE